MFRTEINIAGYQTTEENTNTQAASDCLVSSPTHAANRWKSSVPDYSTTICSVSGRKKRAVHRLLVKTVQSDSEDILPVTPTPGEHCTYIISRQPQASGLWESVDPKR